jgi:hypothetical protein
MANDVPVVRSIVAVAAGFFASNVMSLGGDLLFRRMSPDAFDDKGLARSDGTLFTIMSYEALFVLIAGYVTARIAVRRPMTHALVMAGLVLLGRVPTAVVAWSLAPPWFHIGVMLLIIPAALLGVKLSELRGRSV